MNCLSETVLSLVSWFPLYTPKRDIKHENETNGQEKPPITSILEISTLELIKSIWVHKFPSRLTIPLFSAWSIRSELLTRRTQRKLTRFIAKCKGSYSCDFIFFGSPSTEVLTYLGCLFYRHFCHENDLKLFEF